MLQRTHQTVWRPSTVLLVVGLLLLPLVSIRAEQKETQAIKSVIEQHLATAKLLQGDNIQVTVTDGTITLDGTVNSIGHKRRVEDIVRRVWDKWVIVNNLEVTRAPIPNEQLREEAQWAIDDNAFYGVFDWITVDARDGVVTLNGEIAEPWYEDAFLDDVAKVRGVREVVDKIAVLPVSIRDDQIRHAAARAIYREMYSEPLAGVPNPPIHIIVNDGEAVLNGWVHTPLERMQAENLVEFYSMAEKVIDNLEVGPSAAWAG